jgi:hypothetical protein
MPGRRPAAGLGFCPDAPPHHGTDPFERLGFLRTTRPTGPVLLLALFGSIFRGPNKSLGGLSVAQDYLPVLIVFVPAGLAFFGMPTPLATYREQGILRRLSTTPVPPAWVLGAQLVVNACIAVAGLVALLVVGIAGFGSVGQVITVCNTIMYFCEGCGCHWIPSRNGVAPPPFVQVSDLLPDMSVLPADRPVAGRQRASRTRYSIPQHAVVSPLVT